MNFKNTFLLVIAFAVVLFSSCGDDGGSSAPAATGIVLDQVTLEVEKEASATLIATLEPEGAEGEITWSSSDPSVVAVVDGVLTALKTGTAKIAATHGAFSTTCDVTVTPKQLDPNDLPSSLRGSNYHLIHLDESSSAFLDGKIANDFRPDDVSKFLYVWENTFAAGTPNGLNAYGLAEGWISLIVGNVGWSGAGYNVNADFGQIDMTDVYNNPEDYVFHISLKSSQEGTGYTFIFTDGTAEARVVVGANEMEGVQPYTDFPRDNEWHEIEIPATELRDLGVFFNEPFSDVNIFSFLAGPVSGTTLDMDAIFFYKKAQ